MRLGTAAGGETKIGMHVAGPKSMKHLCFSSFQVKQDHLHKGSSWAAGAKVSLKSKHLCFSQNESAACNPEPVGKPILTAEHSCSKLQPWCLMIPFGREKGQNEKITLENLFRHIRESSIPLTCAIPAD